MKFYKYPKIGETTTSVDKSTQWVVLEKVHGANFSIYCDGTQVRFAKRTGFLEDENEWFYGYQTISAELAAKVSLLFKELRNTHRSITTVVLYGELCGGFYPSQANTWAGAVTGNRINKDRVCVVPQSQRAVQEGVYYSPNLEFVVFDILLVKEHTAPRFMKYTSCVTACSSCSIKVLKPLYTGLYSECVSHPCKFDSNVAVQEFGQERLPPGTNYAEGTVIKPLQESIAAIRPMIKIKHTEFLEIASNFTAKSMQGTSIILSMMNVNRMNALRSKVGKIPHDPKSAEQFEDDLVEDILEDYYEKFPMVPISNYTDTLTLLRAKCKGFISKCWTIGDLSATPTVREAQGTSSPT